MIEDPNISYGSPAYLELCDAVMTEGVELWNRVEGYCEAYIISTFGNIISYKRNKPKLMCPSKTKKGYLRIKLSINGKSTTHSIHTLVLESFAGKRPSEMEVNHKNGIKTDNRLGNLEWVTASENVKHSFQVLGKTLAEVPVSQFNLAGELIASYPSIAKAVEATGLSRSSISQCCTKKRKTCGGFIWQYA